MAQTAGGTYYAASSELVSSWPATSLDLANQLESRFADKSPVSSTGMVLLTPTSVAGSGVSLSGSTVTFTAASSVSINGVFSNSAYENYRVVFKVSAVGSGNPLVSIRLRKSGTDATGANYFGGLVYIGNTSNLAGAKIASATSFQIGQVTASYPNINGADFTIWHPNGAEPTFAGQSVNHTSGEVQFYTFGGNYATSDTYDGLTFILSTATTISGTCRVYGLKG